MPAAMTECCNAQRCSQVDCKLKAKDAPEPHAHVLKIGNRELETENWELKLKLWAGFWHLPQLSGTL